MAETITVRQLRWRTRAVLRRVESGERLQVWRHGRAVAELVPPGRRTWLTYGEVSEILVERLAPLEDPFDHSVRQPFPEPG
jgi:antitoxin (DNA-binding transcriptional repressor) of toxin-antitoxin stability system